MTGAFISWTPENGRTAELAEALGIPAHFIHRPGRFGLTGRYARQHAATRRLLQEQRPDTVVLMLPPAIALLSLGRRRTAPRLIVDLHTGFFLDPKWRWARGPALAAIRRRGGLAIVTNTHLQHECARAGVEAVVLHDVVQDRDALPHTGELLCPLSYANDEPVPEILAAARLTPELRWTLTGRAPDAVRAAAPGNVRFTGFVAPEEFDRLTRSSGAVIALTTRPHTMQRAGYEALHAGVPHVTSDFPELREFYGDAAAYTAPDGAAIAAAARSVLQDRDLFAERTRLLRAQRRAEQRPVLVQLTAALAAASPAHSGSAAPADLMPKGAA
ncbi:Glycosyltransferase [Leucobacter sp. 7(1)]|uniref:glycosyltransferase n=1 Tax=Leucobacter sp. 7(1) TaxID=1255613 RepID=UPI00097F5CC8|nr:glycosyltransferase [Leucobacter sp. 7(1)]SJN11875.1 Glycosyltransferase [Leucobacter sp. 7(1)]